MDEKQLGELMLKFEQVNFSYEDFQAALRTLVKRGQVLVGQQGRSKIYFPMIKGR